MKISLVINLLYVSVMNFLAGAAVKETSCIFIKLLAISFAIYLDYCFYELLLRFVK